MIYKNAKQILPKELIEQIQKYIQGDLIYIPKSESEKIRWGEKNGTKEAMYNRNVDIFKLYIEGLKIDEIVNIYNLSESSIRKIIAKVKKNQINKELVKGVCTNE